MPSFETVNLFTKRRDDLISRSDTFDLIQLIFGERLEIPITRDLLYKFYSYVLYKKRSESNIIIYTKIVSK